MMLVQSRLLSACRIATCIVLLTVATAAFSQSTSGYRYVLPQFNGTTGSELVLSNLSTAAVTAQVRFYNAGGTELSNTNIAVAAGTQVRLDSTFFPKVEGSAVVQSSGPLSVMGTIGQSNGAFENAAPPPAAIDSIIPFSFGNAGKMDLTFVNAISLPTIALIRTYSSDGNPINSVERTVPPLGSLTASVSSLFPLASSSAGREISYIGVRATANVVTEERRLAVQARIRDYSDPSILTAVTASSAAANPALPYFVQGGSYITTLQLLNPSTSPASVAIFAFSNDGRLLSAGKLLTLAPNASIRGSADTLLSLGPDAVSGSIAVRSDVPILLTEAIANTTTNAFMLTAGGAADTGFVFSQRRAVTPTIALALSNQNDTAAQVRVRSVRDDGTPVGQISLTLNPSTSMTKLFSELISDDQIDGYIYVSSDLPIFASAFETNANSTVLANVPVIRSQPGYTPPSPTSFRLKGAVKRVGAGPVPGVAINISGSANLSSLTDTSGNYLQRVAPGSYTIQPSDDKYVFNPQSRVVTITLDDSVGNDFDASLLGPTPKPTLLSISPTTIDARPGGGPPLLLTVTGSQFVAGAKVLLNGVEVPTQYLSPVLLNASVPSSLLEAGGTVQVTVRNPLPTLGISNALPLVVVNPGPFLASVEPASMAFTPGVPVVITLHGANFAPGSLYELTPPCASVFVTNRISGDTATITINMQCAGTYSVRVRTPEPGGGISQTLSLVVN